MVGTLAQGSVHTLRKYERGTYKAVFIVTVVHGNFNADACINQTDDCSRNSNEIGVATIACRGKTNHDGVSKESQSIRRFLEIGLTLQYR